MGGNGSLRKVYRRDDREFLELFRVYRLWPILSGSP